MNANDNDKLYINNILTLTTTDQIIMTGITIGTDMETCRREDRQTAKEALDSGLEGYKREKYIHPWKSIGHQIS